MEIGIWPRLAGASDSRARSPLATLTGGDGVRGARFPTGVDNVVARYRFGAGAPVPEPNTLRLARSVPGIRSIRSPLPFTPGKPVGDDASMRTEARRRALMLERSVSAADYAALAANESGVVRVEAELGWLPDSMTVGVHLTVIGTLDPHALQSSLAAAGEPGTPIEVTLARAATARRRGSDWRHSALLCVAARGSVMSKGADSSRTTDAAMLNAERRPLGVSAHALGAATGMPPCRWLPRRSWPRLRSVGTVRRTRLPARPMQRTAPLARMAFPPTSAADAVLRLGGDRGHSGNGTLRRQGGA